MKFFGENFVVAILIRLIHIASERVPFEYSAPKSLPYSVYAQAEHKQCFPYIDIIFERCASLLALIGPFVCSSPHALFYVFEMNGKSCTVLKFSYILFQIQIHHLYNTILIDTCTEKENSMAQLLHSHNWLISGFFQHSL